MPGIQLLVIVLWALSACKGGASDATWVCFLCADAGQRQDASPGCDPVSQAGCGVAEKCAPLVESDDPLLARTICVPEGTVSEGGACLRGPAGRAGYDNCLAGAACVGGVCSEICSPWPSDSCADDGLGGQTCTVLDDLLSSTIGVCSDSRDARM